MLTVENRTSGTISIDWDRTRYLYNSKENGRFAFKGIDPTSIKSGMPKENILLGETVSKRIYPMKTVGFMGIREVLKPGQSRFIPGIMPNGNNSVMLIIKHGDREWKETLTVKFGSK